MVGLLTIEGKKRRLHKFGNNMGISQCFLVLRKKVLDVSAVVFNVIFSIGLVYGNGANIKLRWHIPSEKERHVYWTSGVYGTTLTSQ